MSTYEEYFRYQREYENQYGLDTIVIYQVGTFYEIFEYDPELEKQEAVNFYEGDVQPGSVVLSNKEAIGQAQYLSNILHLTLTRKCGSKPHSWTNPLMIGFPCISYEKFKDILLNLEFKIVRIDQNKKGKTKTVNVDGSVSNNLERVVKEVISPVTNIDGSGYSQSPSNNLMIIYIECAKPEIKYEDYLIIIGASCMDCTTGKNTVCEMYSKEEDQINALQELFRFTSAVGPKEIIIYCESFPMLMVRDSYIEYLSKTLELIRYSNVVFKFNEVPKDYYQQNYCVALLSRVFENLGKEPDIYSPCKGVELITETPKIKYNNSRILENLGLDKYNYGRISYMLILKYCYDHNELLLSKICKPDTKWIDEKSHLILTHNAILQLDLLPTINNEKLNRANRGKTKIDSLFSVLNNTSTILGKRLLRQMMLNPISNPKRLNFLYDTCDELVNDEKMLLDVEKFLHLPDIERLQRRLQLFVIKPKELSSLLNAYTKLTLLYCKIMNSDKVSLKKLLFNEEQAQQFNECLNKVSNWINVNTLGKAELDSAKNSITMPDYTTSFVKQGVDLNLDQYMNAILQACQNRDLICEHLNSFILGKGKAKVKPISFEEKAEKVKGTDNVNISIVLTTTEAKARKLNQSPIDVNLVGQLQFTTVKKTVHITSDKIDQIVYLLLEGKKYIDHLHYKHYMELLTMLNKYTFFATVTKFISTIDYIKSNAKTAIKYKYYRPTIKKLDTEVVTVDENSPNVNVQPVKNEDLILDQALPSKVKKSNKSYIVAKNLRHPIVERISSREYISNDIELGKDKSGLLVYGINAAGKSCLGKSIALNIIMAQIGCFVPSSEMVYFPYNKIITRLSGNDDMFRDMSSFVVEMEELRTILRQSCDKVLVIGDELARGTETISGISLTTATLITLANRKVSHVFATHMHDLPNMGEIKELVANKSLHICHLSTFYDETNKMLIYDRKLKDGPGNSVYGLDVARYLNLDEGFMKLANTIRKKITKKPEEIVNTNRSRYNSQIFVDKCELCKTQIKLQTHHIEEQSTSNEKGFIGDYHKNSNFNLIVLCEDCHKELHKKGEKIKTCQTVDGLMYVKNKEDV
jgi:DNA mismatch repair protein MutS